MDSLPRLEGRIRWQFENGGGRERSLSWVELFRLVSLQWTLLNSFSWKGVGGSSGSMEGEGKGSEINIDMVGATFTLIV